MPGDIQKLYKKAYLYQEKNNRQNLILSIVYIVCKAVI